MNLFEELGLSQQLLSAIQRLGISEPTQIQDQTIPYIMEGRDVIGESATGSGKTLAFGCGIIDQVIPGKGIQSLILTPTRELAEQVKESLRKLSYQKKLKIITVYGGVSINQQIFDLRSADVVVATPGRLLDHLQRRTINLSKVKLMILDEVDIMLDMGFIRDVEIIMQKCPEQRQTLFFSATITSNIKSLARRFMFEPTEVSVKKYVDPSKLKQVYYDVDKNMKLSLLVHLLKKESPGLIMVFCNTRRNTDFVVKNLKQNQIKAIAIHGGLTQNKRTHTLKSFNNGKVNVLVCTDVAARGLHIDNVSHVYNYDIPKDPRDYVHRIGRTARAGEEGEAVNLLCNYDYENFSRIKSDYREFSINKVERPYIEKIHTIRNDQRSRRPSWGRSGRGSSQSRGRGRSQGRSNNSPRNRFGRSERSERSTVSDGSFHASLSQSSRPSSPRGFRNSASRGGSRHRARRSNASSSFGSRRFGR